MHLRRNTAPFRTVQEAVSPSGEYRPVSYWQETIAVEPGPPLSETLPCDVAIVGGGFTGLSVAYELKQAAPELEVAILELGVVGHGASGRNGGFAMPLIGWDLSGTAKALGDDAAQRAYRFMYGAVAHLKRLVNEHSIDCDMEETGYLLLATSPKRKEHLEDEVRLGQRLGFDMTWLEGPALEEHIRSARFLGGAYDPNPAIVNPAKLARGMKAVVESLGVRIYEQTPVEEIVDGQRIELRTPAANVQARTIVLATNGYSDALGFMSGRVLPVHTYIVATEPLTDEELEGIGWAAKRASLETARNLIHYFRLTADNRIIFGGEDVDLFFGGRYQDAHPRIFRALEARLREFFPSLNDVGFAHAWGGVLGVTLDMFPTFGVGGSQGNVYHAMGYSGHGVALSNYAGKIMAPRILKDHFQIDAGEELSDPFFFNRKPVWIPPEPLRYAGLQLYRQALRAQDAWQKA